ncbi:MAG: hypothetical protein COT91_05415 [Candidatus Doudnabacteria bacterium CG10_big_fil_rev_8_21_14_0_10_41_10]|uniref:Polymerase/histidinol phosphatase N-terminal domain-containing protein n=1 Tax=Candidatus Doudnabacteria bacterium CG10_big_fil_rev_8_21_14_0_10_41_10 TaxID=1974551 RepID=A0A2H0VC48_9BACT|nr:MAG: hypothetical protein COT91_05415 [Candidatus Doudnabacteria bacterium CG10_big_fil_rev_8_21_14_0_10_41_10]
MKSKNTKQLDLHLHSYYSDGRESVGKVFRRAKKAKISLVSLTDHNTTEHLDSAKITAKMLNLKLLPGAEISTIHRGKHFHVLAYGFDPKNQPLQQLLKSLQLKRRKEIMVGVEKIKKLGFRFNEKKLFHFPANYWGIDHLVRIITKTQSNKNRMKKEAGSLNIFKLINFYFAENKPAYIPEILPETEKVIRIIKKAGGFTVIAHPGYHLRFREDSVIHFLKRIGLDGLEVFTPKHNPKQIVHYAKLAKKLNMVVTAGSDYHLNIQKHRIPLPYPVKNLRLPPKIYDDFMHYLHRKGIRL